MASPLEAKSNNFIKIIILTFAIKQNSKRVTNFCFEIRASSDLDEVKVPVEKKHPTPI